MAQRSAEPATLDQGQSWQGQDDAPLRILMHFLTDVPEPMPLSYSRSSLSHVRTIFEKDIPFWIKQKPIVESYWNAMLQTLEGYTSYVHLVAFSLDGKQVVSGSWDNTVRLWDTATGQQIQPTLEGHTRIVYSVAFSPMLSSRSCDIVGSTVDSTIAGTTSKGATTSILYPLASLFSLCIIQ
ncbi:hypothetical protein SS1G_05624 [Sclerotinia sclerotiorum 1980 UF-70]|uniref:Mitochondrial division protein 1 n=1 Tax=Sclerotinia sclerotiorum (strain ATCC 18683 / 1980 / Ss-1) TaxID=665079 RepID=A7EJX8_SCLS1|nr:hypothetical protein SS1G_05624 [Sclerotinia sclerotiorum 1980 UF-70]EDO03144.1 hypothetical protein SS1G_05624 [Sclerotinia sclerotiorum 1980 UF-70]